MADKTLKTPDAPKGAASESASTPPHTPLVPAPGTQPAAYAGPAAGPTPVAHSAHVPLDAGGRTVVPPSSEQSVPIHPSTATHAAERATEPTFEDAAPLAPTTIDRDGLARALAQTSRMLKVSGHQLLGQVSELGSSAIERAAHDIAWAANTGAAPAAIAGLRGLTPRAMADLLADVAEGDLDQTSVTALLRERFPEKRPGSPGTAA
jgi:hypothetical protein